MAMANWPTRQGQQREPAEDAPGLELGVRALVGSGDSAATPV
jgi:hypothetical protein